MEFRNAKREETDAVLQLYRSVVGTQFCVWDEEYPGLAEIDEDLRTGTLFVLVENGTILGAISIVPRNELDSLPFWQIPDAAEIARVVTSPHARGQGLARQMVTQIITLVRQNGYQSIHLLAAYDNLPAIRTYEACGFQLRGKCDMFGHHYLAYELAL